MEGADAGTGWVVGPIEVEGACASPDDEEIAIPTEKKIKINNAVNIILNDIFGPDIKSNSFFIYLSEITIKVFRHTLPWCRVLILFIIA